MTTDIKQREEEKQQESSCEESSITSHCIVCAIKVTSCKIVSVLVGKSTYKEAGRFVFLILYLISQFDACL